MVDDELELLITVVVGAENERQAREACRELVNRVGGRIVEAGDCSDEEPGCWSVTISQPSSERVSEHVTATLARAVRRFVRELGPEFGTPQVACELPTAWTVLDEPAAVGRLVPGCERLLVEAWVGGNPLTGEFVVEGGEDPDESEQPTTEAPWDFEAPDVTHVLWLSVDVATDSPANAQWQARAVASRLARTAQVVECAESEPGLRRVDINLGPVVCDNAQVLQDVVRPLGREGWDMLWEGEAGAITWIAATAPANGIAALQLAVEPLPRTPTSAP
ncbi:hypothetical protein [Allokutzneria oryzae]|uniref:DUF541 domain-containing protein n=1 Tax=Allokutzneria oryzae TaxID=1378989 RepID=A0ABV5ZUG7_9PSEU